jgi:hypothetical protein
MSEANPWQLALKVSLIANGILQRERDSHDQAPKTLRVCKGKYAVSVVGTERL